MLPLSHHEEFSTPANRAACRRSIRQGSQSFHLASLLLPIVIREPAYAVYAFCRNADDLIDRNDGGEDAIRELGQMLDRIYAGRPDSNFVERGFADVVARFAMPRALPEALIEGLAWDAEGRRYRSLDDLKAYAVRVAGTVGLMMTLVMGRREPQVLARACDLGVAMQLTNIARDIGEDAANGRVYMPLDWLKRDGVDVHRWLEAPDYQPIRSIVEQLLGEAEVLYRRSHSGVAALPPTCRLGINAARLLYREIGEEVLGGVDPVRTRAVTSKRTKLRLIASVIMARYQSSAGLAAPCIAQAHFLVEAVARAPQPRRPVPIPPWWDVKARSERMIELLNGFSVRNAAEMSRRGERFYLQPGPYSGSDR
jgi:phytoene synthase